MRSRRWSVESDVLTSDFRGYPRSYHVPSRQCHMRSFKFHLITPACHSLSHPGIIVRAAVFRCGCLDPLAPGRCAHFHVEPAPSLCCPPSVLGSEDWGFPSQLDFALPFSRTFTPHGSTSSRHPHLLSLAPPLLPSRPFLILPSPYILPDEPPSFNPPWLHWTA